MIKNTKFITSSSFLAMLFLGVGYSLVGAAARNIGLTPAQIGLLLAAQNVGFAVAVAVAGALSDTLPKPRILLFGSILLAGGLLGFYVVPIFWVNVLVCVLIGLGIGAYEGATDALLFDLHGNRAGPYVNINHLCVTLGGALIALYVIFLNLLWRSAVVQAGLAVAVMAVVFALTRLPVKGGQATLQAKVRIITSSRIVAVLFVCSLLTIGASAATTGMLSTFLAEQRGVAPVTAKLGLVIFLAGVAAGRIVIGAFARPHRLYRMLVILFALSTGMFALLFLVDLGPLTLLAVFLAGLTLSAQLPFLLTYAGLAYPAMTGTVLGAIKIAIPLGGIVTPLLIAAITSRASFGAALLVIPLGLLVGLLMIVLLLERDAPQLLAEADGSAA